jgi:pyruvate/2-oxoglutarate dehydrogenase complex dihydrolipoamide dehydrogenase (E3) component
MTRVRRVVDTIAPHDSPERYEGLGVEVIQGEARITGPWSVDVGGRELTTRHIVVATGAEPAIPAIPGLGEVGYWTSETLWALDTAPGRLLVLGGGPIGCELSQAFARLGAEVTLVERAPRILMGEDEDAAAVVEAALTEDGVRVLKGCEVEAFQTTRGEGGVAKIAVLRSGETLLLDRVLVAVGRKARVTGFGLEDVGVTLTPEGRIETDAYLETRIPSIYAAGDCVGPHLFTHAASHQAWHAAVNALFWNPFKRFKVDNRFLPHATYTDPEVARVGPSEAEARARGVAFEVTRFDLGGSDRALADEAARGFVKVLTPPGKDRILGATVVGPRAGDLIAQFTLAMKHGIGLNKILGTIHPYPTLMEANKSVAGAWKRAHAPAGALRWVERYHTWRRGRARAHG